VVVIASAEHSATTSKGQAVYRAAILAASTSLNAAKLVRERLLREKAALASLDEASRSARERARSHTRDRRPSPRPRYSVDALEIAELQLLEPGVFANKNGEIRYLRVAQRMHAAGMDYCYRGQVAYQEPILSPTVSRSAKRRT
jgi:hypothetical protein